LVRNSRIILLPEAEFASVPFPALVRQFSKEPTSVDWLAHHFSVSVVPSVRAFVALRSRRHDDLSTPRSSFVGFADPIVEIDPRQCASVSAWGKASKSQGICPVPETLDHVFALARAWSTDPVTSIFAGPRMTLEAVKREIASPTRMIAFATHGFLSEE